MQDEFGKKEGRLKGKEKKRRKSAECKISLKKKGW